MENEVIIKILLEGYSYVVPFMALYGIIGVMLKAVFNAFTKGELKL